MNKKHLRSSAFITLRALVACCLCLAAVMLGFFALGQTQTTHLPSWLTSLASTLGMPSSKAHSTGASAIKIDKYPLEPAAGNTQSSAVITYGGAPQLLTPVTPVRTGKLRDMTSINPDKVVKFYHPEPLPPKFSKKSGRSAKTVTAAAQTEAGPQASAPTAAVNFEGVGVGLAGFSPS